jgi:hypothetical protein
VTRRRRQRPKLALSPDGTVAAPAVDDGLPTKERIQRALQGRFFLRVHMFVILGLTIAAGVLSTHILYAIRFTNMAWRYGIAVGAAYAAFIGLIRLWLRYVTYCISARTNSDLDWLGGFDLTSDGFAISLPSPSSSGGSAAKEVFESGGGRFGGGGATGSWGEPSSAPMRAAVATTSKSPSSSSSSGGGGFGLDLDEDLGLIILVIVLALAIAIAAIWLIWAAPVILGEAAFQTALAAALARKTKTMTRDSAWVGSVVKATILPFVAVLAAAVALGWYAHHHCESATRLSDAFQCDRSGILPPP